MSIEYMFKCDTDTGPLPAGTIYNREMEALAYGLPSRASMARSAGAAWVTRDRQDYKGQQLFAGRGQAQQTARCDKRRFAPTPATDAPPADAGDGITENQEVTAETFHPRF